MHIGKYTFNRLEFAGSLGDLGTLIPLSVTLIIVAELSITTVFLLIGLFYIISGLYFRLPIPVQPLKAVSAIIIASPENITKPVIAASGLTLGIILLFLASTGLINWLARFFTKPIIRGIQLGIGLILITKGITYIMKPELLIQGKLVFLSSHISLNLLIGIGGFFLTLLLLASKRFPAALVIVLCGFCIGAFASVDTFSKSSFLFGPSSMSVQVPELNDFFTALFLLVLPQLPLTLGNAVIGVSDTCMSLFGKGSVTEKVSIKAFATSIGIANIITGIFAGIPLCHGAGGLAAHYRFHARTGGATIMLGTILIVLSLVFGKIGLMFLTLLPHAILGILLLFAGLEMSILIRDVTNKNDLFVTILIAGIGYVTQNMGIAFIVGIVVNFILKWRKISL